MDRKMKKVDYRPQEFRTMDPTFRYNMWTFERRAGHLFTDSKRIANFQSALLALAIGGIYGLIVMMGIGRSNTEVDKLLEHGPDANKKKAK